MATRKIFTNQGAFGIDDDPTPGSVNAVSSGGVAKALSVGEGGESIGNVVPSGTSSENPLVNKNDVQDTIDDAMSAISTGYIPKGTASVSAINSLTEQQNGDMYVVSDSGTISDGNVTVNAGESVAWDASNSVWYKVNNYALRQFGTDNVKNLPTTITSFRNGDVIPVDGPSGPAKMAYTDVIDAVNSVNLPDNSVHHKLSYTITSDSTTAITPQAFKGGKLYTVKIRSQTIVSRTGIFECAYAYYADNSYEVIASCTAQELYTGIDIVVSKNADWTLWVRTYEANTFVTVDSYEKVNDEFLNEKIDRKADRSYVEETRTDTVVYNETLPKNTSIYLKKGITYKLYAKSRTLDPISTVPIFYIRTDPGTLVLISQCKNTDLYAGFEYTYTPTTDCILCVRCSSNSNITLDVAVTNDKAFASQDDFDSLKSQVDFGLRYTASKNVVPNSTTAYSTGIVLKKDFTYTISMLSLSQVAKTGMFEVAYSFPIDGSAYSVIHRTTASDLYAGITFTYTPTKDTGLSIRTYEAGVTVVISLTWIEKAVSVDYVDQECRLSNVLKGKTWACYGDSITAISNGDGLALGWAKYVNDAVRFSQFYGRGAGGQKFGYGSNGGSVVFVNATTGEYNSRNDSYNKDNYAGAIPDGCVAVRGSFCSWDRITHMFPVSIKDSIDIVCIMGGTNDIYNDAPAEFVENSNTDAEWTASGADYYGLFNGDYNITTLKGGIASCVMKFQVWMPNAIIVICTPLSGRGVAGQRSTDLNVDEYPKTQVIKEMAERTSSPCIDVFGICGISPFNRVEYITDGVHPYSEAGKKMLARAFIMGFKIIEPMI